MDIGSSNSGRASKRAVDSPSCASASVRLLGFLLFSFYRGTVAQAADSSGAELELAVRGGDTLIAISERYLAKPADWPKLQRLNKVANPRRLHPGSTIRIPFAWLREAADKAEVLSVAGSSVTVDGVPAAVGSRLNPGAVVRTGADGYATLRTHDGSLIALQPRSEARIASLGKFVNTDILSIFVRLVSGRVEALVNKLNGQSRFEVQTDLTIAGVRGTRFRVAAATASAEAKARAQTEVIEGTVSFVASGTGPGEPPVSVTAGNGSVTDDNRRPRPATALLPAPQMDAGDALQERLVVRFRFPAVPGANNYRAQIATDREFRQGIADAAFTTPEIKFGDLPEGEYFLRARSIDALGLEGRDVVFQFRLKARPEPPLATLPAPHGKLRATAASFAWGSNPQANSYRIQIAYDEAFARVVQDEAATGVEFESRSLPFGDYYWRLRSIRTAAGGADPGPWGDIRKFSLRPPPRNPEPPEETGDSLRFSWLGEPGQTFVLQVARDALFSQMLEARQLAEPKASIKRPPQGVYYVRARATDADGFVGPATAPQRIVLINRVLDSGGANLTTGEGNPVRLQ